MPPSLSTKCTPRAQRPSETVLQSRYDSVWVSEFLSIKEFTLISLKGLSCDVRIDVKSSLGSDRYARSGFDNLLWVNVGIDNVFFMFRCRYYCSPGRLFGNKSVIAGELT